MCLPVAASLGSLRSPRLAFWGFLKAFLAPGPKPLPEQLIFIAREPFFRYGPNIWLLEPSESRFKAFLASGPKPLPERLIFIAREPFFALDRISGF